MSNRSDKGWAIFLLVTALAIIFSFGVIAGLALAETDNCTVTTVIQNDRVVQKQTTCQE